jgi:proteasome component ECM29
LDSKRLSAAKSSPIMEAIDQCCQYINAEILTSFVPKLCVIIKKGVGLPTRAGTARLIYILVLKLSPELTPHADTILKALTVAIHDRNPIVRKSFSTATGYICKLASHDAIEKLAMKLSGAYLDSNEEDGRSIAPITFLEMSRHAGTPTQEIHNIILPLAFMGARDTFSTALKEVWEKVWEENTGGSSNAIKKWKKDLFDSCSNILKTNPSWSMKKQVGKALGDIAKALGEEVISLFPQCLNLLVESLNGRTWDGKESILEALAVVCKEGNSFFEENLVELELVETVFIREAKKQNLAYRRFAVEYLGLSFDALKSRRFIDVKEYLAEVTTEKGNDDDMDVDEDKVKPLRLMVNANAFKSLALCFPHAEDIQGDHCDWTGEFLSSALLNQVWNIRVSILDGLNIFLSKLSVKVLLSDKCCQSIFDGVLVCLSDGKVPIY